ncbi:T9SS type A sorting domain-containing protein, partial [candidate division WOR-3 bacterium]|nr:T9SS type A sorting domain-containing protein [candidate division WOR-3 bacterium]
PTSNHCAVFFPPENRIYVFGGSEQVSYDYVQVYDIIRDSWTVRYMPYPDYGMSAAVVAESIFVVFGQELPRRLYRYYPHTDNWAQRAMLPDTAYQGAMCAVAGKVYYAGGWDSLRVFRGYDPQTNAWSDLPDLPQGRHGLSLLPVGRRIYLVGGGQRWNTQYDYRNVYCFDVDSGYWRYDSRMSANHIAGAFGSGVALTLNRLYACGGYSGTNLTDAAWLPSIGIGEGPRSVPAAAGITCQPNPFTHRLAIAAPDHKPVDVSDVSGQAVIRLTPESGTAVWNCSESPAGIYLVRSGTATALVRRVSR